MQQIPETIWIDGAVYRLHTTPLSPWLSAQQPSPVFDIRTPTCSRGYIGRWEIRDERLWLIDLHAWRDGTRAAVADLFDAPPPVHAAWFSGPLHVEPDPSEVTDQISPHPRTLHVEAGVVTTPSG